MSTGAKQYHGKRGVAYYLEFPAPDDLHFDMMSNVSALAHYSSAVPKIVVDGTSLRDTETCLLGEEPEGCAFCTERQSHS